MSTKIANINPLNLVIIREEFPSKDNQKTANNDITDEDVLKFIHSYLEINGFLLVFRREEFTTIENNVLKRFGYKYDKSLESKQFISIAERIGLSLVSKRSYENTSSVLLFRKVETERSAEDVIIRISHTDYDLWFDKLLNEMKVSTDITQNSPQNQRLIWLVSDAEQISGIVGFVKCLRREPGGHRIRCISDMMFENLVPSNSVSVRELIDNSLFDNNLVMNIYRNGELGSYRHMTLNRERLRKRGVKHAMLFPSLGANKMNVQWVESQHNSFYNIDNIVVDVHWTGLNPSDLKIGTNTSTVEPIYAEFTGVKGLCSEFSGLDENGNRVFGIKTNKSLSTTLLFETKRDLIAVPDQWSLEEACSVPLAYGTALFALIIKAQLKSHNSILIHSGHGYVGRAAISVALSRECQVYTTVPSDETKKQLMAQFSDLDETKVINTSIDSFKEVIFDKTLGNGLDFVFDYTNDFPFDSNLFCLKHNGRYLLVNDYHGFGSKGSGL